MFVYDIDVYYDKIRLSTSVGFIDVLRESKSYDKLLKQMHDAFAFCETSTAVCDYISRLIQEGDIELWTFY